MRSELENQTEETAKSNPDVWPGEVLYETGRKLLMISFFTIFLLIAHQKFYTGYLHSKGKLVALMCVAPFVIGGGFCCVIGWWRMKLTGGFDGPATEVEEEEKRKIRRQRRDADDLLPWQRRPR